MALDAAPAPVDDARPHSSGPLTASLRWGFRWTIVVASLGTAAGCVSASPVAPPISTHDSYLACVAALGDMPDAANHHLDACEAVARATTAIR